MLAAALSRSLGGMKCWLLRERRYRNNHTRKRVSAVRQMPANPNHFQVTSQLRKPCWYNCLPLWSQETVIARLAIWSLPSCLCCPGEWSLFLNVALPPKMPELESRCYPSHVLNGNAQPSFVVCFFWNVHITPGSCSSDLLPHTQNSGQGCLLKHCLSERRGGNDLNSHPWETGYRSQMEYYAAIKKEWGSTYFTDMMPSPKYTVK